MDEKILELAKRIKEDTEGIIKDFKNGYKI